MRADWHDRVREILEPLPTTDGGLVAILATSGVPPAMAMLSSGDVLVSDHTVRAGVFGTSSTVSRLGEGFSLMVPAGPVALRVEAMGATATLSGSLAMLEGRLENVRPTTEPPWIADMRFWPSNTKAAAIPAHLEYWASVRTWLSGDGPPPAPPT